MLKPPLSARLLPIVTPLDPRRWADALREEANQWLQAEHWSPTHSVPGTRISAVIVPDPGLRVMRMELELARPAPEVWSLLSDPRREGEWRGAPMLVEPLEQHETNDPIGYWRFEWQDLPSPFARSEEVRLHAAWPGQGVTLARSVHDRRVSRRGGVTRNELWMWVARVEEVDAAHTRVTLLWAGRDRLPGWLGRWLAPYRGRKIAAGIRACLERLPER